MRKIGRGAVAATAATLVMLVSANALAAGDDEARGWFEGKTTPAEDDEAPALTPVPAPSAPTKTTTTTTSTTTSTTTTIGAGADAASEAPAKNAAAVGRERAKPATEWYGWQTLLVDSVSVTTLIAAVASAPNGGEALADTLLPHRIFSDSRSQTSPAFDAGLALYTAGPGIIHALHGRMPQSLGSVAIRAAGPTVGVVAGAIYGGIGAIGVMAFSEGHNGDNAAMYVFAGGIATGYLAGVIVPIVIDATTFGHEPVDESSAKAKEHAKASTPTVATVRPSLGFGKNGPTLGFTGTF